MIQACSGKEMENNNIKNLKDESKITINKIKNYNPKDFMKNSINSSFQIIDGNKCYELVTGTTKENEDIPRESKVFISKLNSKGVYQLEQVLENPYNDGEAWSDKGLYLIDVNFDNAKDIIVDNGHYGVQGLLRYTAFLWEGGKYKINDSFTEIENPSIDYKNKVILGSWRNDASSHGHAMYKFKNKKYETYKMLTIFWTDSEIEGEEPYIGKYLVEEWDDMGRSTEKEYTVGEYTKEELEKMFCDPGTEWAIYSDKWSGITIVENN